MFWASSVYMYLIMKDMEIESRQNVIEIDTHSNLSLDQINYNPTQVLKCAIEYTYGSSSYISALNTCHRQPQPTVG